VCIAQLGLLWGEVVAGGRVSRILDESVWSLEPERENDLRVGILNMAGEVLTDEIAVPYNREGCLPRQLHM